jgi:hypothetical protein
VSGVWKYDNNAAYYTFTPEEGDILVASINFDADTITSLQGQNSTNNGIAKGYASGDLVYTPDQFAGGYNDGEFTVSGTSFTPNKLVRQEVLYGGGMPGRRHRQRVYNLPHVSGFAPTSHKKAVLWYTPSRSRPKAGAILPNMGISNHPTRPLTCRSVPRIARGNRPERGGRRKNAKEKRIWQ